MSWYKDKAINTIDAKLALAGAGAGAKAFSKLARIPLEMDDRKMKQQVLDNRAADTAAKISVAEANNRAKIMVGKMGLQGKQAAAAAKEIAGNILAGSRVNAEKIKQATSKYRTDADINIEDSRSETAKRNRENKKEVAKLRTAAKAPTQEEYFYDKDGNKVKKVNRAYVPPVDFTIDALDIVAKKARKKH